MTSLLACPKRCPAHLSSARNAHALLLRLVMDAGSLLPDHSMNLIPVLLLTACCSCSHRAPLQIYMVLPQGETTAQVPGAKEEWGVAGGGEMGDATQLESEAQMQAGSSAPPSASSTPGLAQAAPTHDVSTPALTFPSLRWLSFSQFLPSRNNNSNKAVRHPPQL